MSIIGVLQSYLSMGTRVKIDSFITSPDILVGYHFEFGLGYGYLGEGPWKVMKRSSPLTYEQTGVCHHNVFSYSLLFFLFSLLFITRFLVTNVDFEVSFFLATILRLLPSPRTTIISTTSTSAYVHSCKL